MMSAQSDRPCDSDGLTIAERRAKAYAQQKPFRLARAAAQKQAWQDKYYTKLYGADFAEPLTEPIETLTKEENDMLDEIEAQYQLDNESVAERRTNEDDVRAHSCFNLVTHHVVSSLVRVCVDPA